jgi:hypothetical protein
MCKEMPVILVNRVVDKKRIIGKMEGRGGGDAQGVADPKRTSLNSDKLVMTLKAAHFLASPFSCSTASMRQCWSG